MRLSHFFLEEFPLALCFEGQVEATQMQGPLKN